MIKETLNLKNSVRLFIFVLVTKLKFIDLQMTNSILDRFHNTTKIPVNIK